MRPSPAFVPHALPLVLGLLLTACGGGDYAADMREQHAHDAPTPSGAVDGVDTTETVGRTVTYATLDGRPVTGFLARPASESEAPRPGLIVVHEWWGLNDNVRAMTRRLAAEGYVALAVDLYGGRVAETPDSAMAFLQTAMGRQEALMGTVAEAIDYLRTETGAPRVGVLGWCFGGGWALETALALPERVDAAVMYYGRVVTDRDRLAALDAPLLGHFGGADASIPVADVRAMEAALRALGRDVEVHVYDGAAHAFANPSGGRYDAAAAEAAWGRTTAFLRDELMGE